MPRPGGLCPVFYGKYYPFPLTKIRGPLSIEEAGPEKKRKNFVFFCLRNWGGGPGTGLQTLSSLLPQGLQSHPTSPAPITQAEKTKFIFFGASLLNAQRSPDFGQQNG